MQEVNGQLAALRKMPMLQEVLMDCWTYFSVCRPIWDELVPWGDGANVLRKAGARVIACARVPIVARRARFRCGIPRLSGFRCLRPLALTCAARSWLRNEACAASVELAKLRRSPGRYTGGGWIAADIEPSGASLIGLLDPAWTKFGTTPAKFASMLHQICGFGQSGSISTKSAKFGSIRRFILGHPGHSKDDDSETLTDQRSV